jgi:hypothetical protein
MIADQDDRPMASRRMPAHRSPMVEIVVLLALALAFLLLVAAVPIELGEERRDERERRLHARDHRS